MGTSVKLRITRFPGLRFVSAAEVAIIAITTFWVFWPAIAGEWLWDDDVLITSNENLRSVEGLWRIWFTAPQTDYWPLTWTFLWALWKIFETNSLGYHLCSVCLHLTSALLIWRLFAGMGARRMAWVGGLIFAIHPVNVESVAWASELKNTLSLPLLLASLLAWVNFAEKRGKAWYAASLLLFLASMLSKTSGAMMPLVLVIFGWWKSGTFRAVELKRISPFLLVSLALGLATLHTQGNLNPDSLVESRTAANYLSGAAAAIAFYVRSFFLPIDLMPIYPRSQLASLSANDVLILLAVVAAIGASIAYRRSWGRHLLLGSSFFLLNLLPVLGLFRMSYMNVSWVADHLAYLPSIGLIGIVVAGLEGLRMERKSVASIAIVPVAVVAMCVALALKSRSYDSIFQGPKSFWEYATEKNPESAVAQYNLGQYYQTSEKDLSRAMPAYGKAISLMPGYWQAYNNLANCMKGDSAKDEERARLYEKALATAPNSIETLNNYAALLNKLNRPTDAMIVLERASQVAPSSAVTSFNLGIAYDGLKNREGSIAAFRDAIRLDSSLHEAAYELALLLAEDPDSREEATELLKRCASGGNDTSELEFNLGCVLMKIPAKSDEAVAAFEKSIAIDANNADAENNIAVILSKLPGRLDEAMRHSDRAIAIRPRNAEFRYNRAGLAAKIKGGEEEAIAGYSKALELKPEYPEAENGLGIVLARVPNRLDDAISHFRSAIRLRFDYPDAQYNLNAVLQLQAAISKAEKR